MMLQNFMHGKGIKMKEIKLVFNDYIPNEMIKPGDVFHRIYEVVSEPKRGHNGYEWKIHHRRWNKYLRMIRPEPELFKSIEPQSFVSVYQRYLIPMQLHPRIEAFYDVRHIGGSTAFFTEWSDNGTLAECIENGSLYDGKPQEVAKRLRRISGQTARALQYIKTVIPYHGAAIPENIMLNDRFNAKLRVASMDLMTGKPIGDDMKLWAVSVTMMYLGRLTNINADELSKSFPEYKAQMKYEMPGEIEKSVLEALTGKLSSWMQVFKNLGEWHFRDIPDGYHYGYLNNLALRLIDCGKSEEAYSILYEESELSSGIRYHNHAEYNLMQLNRYLSEEIAKSDCRRLCYYPNDQSDILGFAEKNDRLTVDVLLSPKNRYCECIEPYLPEIREKVLDRPRMTQTDIAYDDPRLQSSGENILTEIDGETVTFKPVPDNCQRFPIPSKDGLYWDNGRLILPDRGIKEGVDYIVEHFDGKRYYFDEGYKRILVDTGSGFSLFPVEQYDNLFRAPFLLSVNKEYDDTI